MQNQAGARFAAWRAAVAQGGELGSGWSRSAQVQAGSDSERAAFHAWHDALAAELNAIVHAVNGLQDWGGPEDYPTAIQLVERGKRVVQRCAVDAVWLPRVGDYQDIAEAFDRFAMRFAQ